MAFLVRKKRESLDAFHHGSYISHLAIRKSTNSSDQVIGDKLSDFVLGQSLGRGSFGSVVHVHSLRDEGSYVLKKVSTKNKSISHQRSAVTEVLILRRCSHPHLVHYFGSFLDNDCIYIILEFCSGGDMGMLVQNLRNMKRHLHEIMIWRYLLQLSEGANHLHTQHVVHRDIKPANILLTHYNDIKIGDFGSARLAENYRENRQRQQHMQLSQIREDKRAAHQQVSSPSGLSSTLDSAARLRSKGKDRVSSGLSVHGTLEFLSPEVLKSKPHSYHSDMWALGVTLYYIMSLRLPFGTGSKVSQKIVHEDPPPLPSFYTKELCDIVRSLLCKVPNGRPTAAEILELIPTRYRDRWSYEKHPELLMQLMSSSTLQHQEGFSPSMHQQTVSQTVLQQQSSSSTKPFVVTAPSLHSPWLEQRFVDQTPASTQGTGNVPPGCSSLCVDVTTASGVRAISFDDSNPSRNKKLVRRRATMSVSNSSSPSIGGANLASSRSSSTCTTPNTSRPQTPVIPKYRITTASISTTSSRPTSASIGHKQISTNRGTHQRNTSFESKTGQPFAKPFIQTMTKSTSGSILLQSSESPLPSPEILSPSRYYSFPHSSIPTHSNTLHWSLGEFPHTKTTIVPPSRPAPVKKAEVSEESKHVSQVQAQQRVLTQQGHSPALPVIESSAPEDLNRCTVTQPSKFTFKPIFKPTVKQLRAQLRR